MTLYLWKAKRKMLLRDAKLFAKCHAVNAIPDLNFLQEGKKLPKVVHIED